MKFQKIQPYGADAYTYWICGTYKIVSYRRGEYFAYFIQDWANNWGDHVAPPPHIGKYSKCWHTFAAAKRACQDHAKKHTPAPQTIQRAAEIKLTLIKQAAHYS